MWLHALVGLLIVPVPCMQAWDIPAADLDAPPTAITAEYTEFLLKVATGTQVS